MSKFKTRSVGITAVQNNVNDPELAAFVGELHAAGVKVLLKGNALVVVSDREHVANPGDYIIRDADDKVYTMGAEIFAKVFKAA